MLISLTFSPCTTEKYLERPSMSLLPHCFLSRVLVIWNSVLGKAHWPSNFECPWLFIILIIVCTELDISDLGLSFEKSAFFGPHSVLNWIVIADSILSLSSFLVHLLDFFLFWPLSQTQMLSVLCYWWSLVSPLCLFSFWGLFHVFTHSSSRPYFHQNQQSSN